MMADGIGNHFESPHLQRRIGQVGRGLPLKVIGVVLLVLHITFCKERMAKCLMFPDLKFGKQGLEQFYTICSTVLTE